MDRAAIDGVFQDWFNGHANFMTPTIVNRGKCRQFLYELSKGEGIDRSTIYGVTVLELLNEDAPDVMAHRHDLNRCCHSKDEALKYIAQLRAQAKYERITP